MWYKKLAAFLKQKGRHRMICRMSEDGTRSEDYLERFYILSTPILGVYIHRFWADDLDGLHDHPWDSFSWILEGGYKEQIAGETQPLIRMAGDTHYRHACEAHRITLLPGDAPGSCWTLFVRFRRKRIWGFYTSEWFAAPKQSRKSD